MNTPFATAERSCDFRVTEIVYVAQREGHTLLRWQLGKCSHERPTSGKHRIPVETLRRSRLLSLGQKSERGFRLSSASAAFEPPKRVAHRYPVNPSIECFRIAELPKRSQDVDRDVLGDVGSLLPTPQKRRRSPQCQASRTAGQSVNPVGIAALIALYFSND
jgi:hypothetical protein